jgi:hypothetical protein
MFNELDAESTFNIIDNIFVEESLKDAHFQGNLSLIRAKLNKIYDRESNGTDDNSASGNGPIEYTEQTEEGFVGLEAPMG